MRIGDYVTVLRDGRLQAEARVADIDVAWIIRQMVGPIEHGAGRPTTRRPANSARGRRSRAAAAVAAAYRGSRFVLGARRRDRRRYTACSGQDGRSCSSA